jgi:hypothetical protein
VLGSIAQPILGALQVATNWISNPVAWWCWQRIRHRREGRRKERSATLHSTVVCEQRLVGHCEATVAHEKCTAVARGRVVDKEGFLHPQTSNAISEDGATMARKISIKSTSYHIELPSMDVNGTTFCAE